MAQDNHQISDFVAGAASSAETILDMAYAIERVNHTGTQSADTMTNGTANRIFTTTEQSKLSGIATGSTANDTDANLKSRANHTGAQAQSTVTNLVADLGAKADLVGGLVPSSQLPSYVDDVLEYASLASFPFTGESGKTYTTVDTNKQYRWTGSAYVVVSDTIALGETSATAYRGDRGKLAYDHSILTSGNPHNVSKADVGLPLADNTADSAKPVSILQAAADAAVQAAAVQRGNHTGTQSADTLTDGTTNKAFLATERTKLAGVASGATANDTDANLKSRANHTGTQDADTITNGTTNKVFTVMEQSKLAGIAAGATVNSSDAALIARSNHTGTQAQATIDNLVADLQKAGNLGIVMGAFR